MTTTKGPLDGVRIVEIDAIGPVPLAAMILADLGAEVVRIARSAEAGISLDTISGVVTHRNRPHVELNLKQEADRDRALDLIARADGLIEGFRPGVMERLGLGPDVCLARNPQLVYARMTGWGQTGPLSLRAGHDINYIALTGALHAMGEADRPPVPPLNLLGDYGGGAMFAVVGLLSALISARSGGKGQVIDIAMTEGTAVLTSLMQAFRSQGLWSDVRASNMLDGSRPFYRCYACADAGHVAVGAIEPAFFAALLAGLDLPADRFNQHDPAGWPDMEAAFASTFAMRSRDDWTAVFADTDACVSPVLSFSEAARHPHNADRESFLALDGVTQPAPAPRFSVSATPVDPDRRGLITMDQALARWG